MREWTSTAHTLRLSFKRVLRRRCHSSLDIKLGDIMPGKKVILYPDHLIQCPDDFALHLGVNHVHIHHCTDHNIDDVAEENAHVDVFYSELRSLFPVLEAWEPGVHDAYVVEVDPERACG